MARQEILCINRNDDDGNPDGGTVRGKGINIKWQKGPLGNGKDRKEPNGAFVVDVIIVAKQRIDFYQKSGFACRENELAISYLQQALMHLDLRTKRRENEGVEGTHEGN